ncbi:IS3 family insertion sequence transposase domain-containing protein (plasmid) [Rhizobium phaseoli Brasil 5]|nr:IS3 family insertion sequence transposase domain-containing protein [Rhizobium phaseoli Brasil 5]
MTRDKRSKRWSGRRAHIIKKSPYCATSPMSDGVSATGGFGGRERRWGRPHLRALSRRRTFRSQAEKPGRHAVGTRGPILVEAKANARCSLNLVHDQFACGRRFRVLNFVEDVTRECLAAIPDTSILRRRVARELSVLIERRGKPGMIVSDNGTEFTSNAILARSKDHRVESHGITPGSRCKTLMSRASTAGCGTRWSTKACSSAAIMPEAPLLGRRLQPLPAALIARTRPGQVMQIPLPQPAPTLREMKASRFRHLAYSERAGSSRRWRGSSARSAGPLIEVFRQTLLSWASKFFGVDALPTAAFPVVS